MYQKNFTDTSEGNMEIFSAFFSAIKAFVREMVLKKSTELKTIDMGDYIVTTNNIPEIDTDIVIIADKGDSKIINKVFPKINKIILNHKALFIGWSGDLQEFEEVLDKPLSDLIYTNKKLVDKKSIAEYQQTFLSSMWSQKGDISSQVHENLVKEKSFLMSRLGNITDIRDKLKILNDITEISEKLKDQDDYLKYKVETQKIEKEINDLKIKLKYYLDNAKISINHVVSSIGSKTLKDINFREVFLNLYSFSSKLKQIAEPKVYRKYETMAKKLMDKDEVSNDELSSIVSEILALSTDIDDFLK
jgi:hypothetical protein